MEAQHADAAELNQTGRFAGPRTDLRPIAPAGAGWDSHPMNKRVASALMWFIVGWYGWAFIAAATGLPPALGLVLGTILAAFVAGDPLHRVWTEQPSGDTAQTPGSLRT